MKLDDIGVMQLVVLLDSLSVKNATAPDPGEFQRLLEVLVNVPGQVQNGAADGHGERSRPINRFARDFRVNAKHSQ